MEFIVDQVKENVQWSISSSLKRYYNKVKKDSYLQICVWDSVVNSMMLHQPFRYYLVIEVEKMLLNLFLIQ